MVVFPAAPARDEVLRQARFHLSPTASSGLLRVRLTLDRPTRRRACREPFDPGLDVRAVRGHGAESVALLRFEALILLEVRSACRGRSHDGRPMLSWVSCPLEPSFFPRWTRPLGGGAPLGQPPLLGDHRPPLTSFSSTRGEPNAPAGPQSFRQREAWLVLLRTAGSSELYRLFGDSRLFGFRTILGYRFPSKETPRHRVAGPLFGSSRLPTRVAPRSTSAPFRRRASDCLARPGVFYQARPTSQRDRFEGPLARPVDRR